MWAMTCRLAGREMDNLTRAIKNADENWICEHAKGKGLAECSLICNQPHCLKREYLKPIMVAVKIKEMEDKG